MANYQPGNTMTLNEAMLRLMLNDSYESKLPALIQFTQHAIDQAYAALLGYRYLDDGENPNHRILAAWAATLLDITEIKTMLSMATTFYEDNNIGTGINGALYGHTYPEFLYWNFIMGLGGSKSIRDPYNYIDGGKMSAAGSSYQNIVSQSFKGQALIYRLFPELKGCITAAHWTDLDNYAERWVTHGAWAQPDPCAPYDGIPENCGKTFGPDPNNPGKCIIGSGRFPQYDGANKDGGQYRSPFVAAMWDAYRYRDVSGDGSVTAYDAALTLQLGRGELEAAQIGQRTVN